MEIYNNDRKALLTNQLGSKIEKEPYSYTASSLLIWKCHSGQLLSNKIRLNPIEQESAALKDIVTTQEH